jgi:DNA-binding NarL/FixJ family response regulator
MKSVLVVCEQSHVDVPLRRSLAHLVTSCAVSIASNGYQAFDELKEQAFDLIIVDSEISGIDSLELVESAAYIDPGVPFIVMLQQEHKALWGPTRQLHANPILRPFKPITFLRLIDTLLHEHLERYRELAETLKSILESLNAPTQAPLTFLVDDSGQPLMYTGQFQDDLIDQLGQLVISQTGINEQPIPIELPKPHLAQNSQDANHYLYVTTIAENLHLGFVYPAHLTHLTPDDIWQWVDSTAKEVKLAFNEGANPYTSENDSTALNGPPFNGKPLVHTLIPLNLNSTTEIENVTQEEIPINWQIITDSPKLLSRLQAFCQVR